MIIFRRIKFKRRIIRYEEMKYPVMMGYTEGKHARKTFHYLSGGKHYGHTTNSWRKVLEKTVETSMTHPSVLPILYCLLRMVCL